MVSRYCTAFAHTRSSSQLSLPGLTYRQHGTPETKTVHWKAFLVPVVAFKSINSFVVKYRTAARERRNGFMDLSQTLVRLGQLAMSSDHLKPAPRVGLYHRVRPLVSQRLENFPGRICRGRPKSSPNDSGRDPASMFNLHVLHFFCMSCDTSVD